MKKLLVLTLGALAMVACSQQKNTNSEADTETVAADSITAGNFEVRDLDGYRLHIYLTDDEMADASFIIEGADSLVTLEQPLFKVNATDFDTYLASLGKPVATRIADFHLGNTGDAPVVMPQGMPEVVKGPDYSGMMNHFSEVYGDAIVALPTGTAEEVAFDSTAVFAGVPFTFYKGASNGFPGANILIGKDAVYSHWAPSKCHINNLYASSIEGIDARLAELEQILATGASVFVGGHGAPATVDDVRFRIEYLNKIKDLRASQPDAAAFTAALIEAYPGLPAEDGVKGLAEALYAQQ